MFLLDGVTSGDDIMDKVSFDNAPGSVVTDLLAAIARGKKKDNLAILLATSTP